MSNRSQESHKVRLTHDNQIWIDNFRKTRNRSPSILHIGNIANNAYNNAKLLIQAGFDCDVICYDYYHTMACPEWEDASFQPSFESDLRPIWFLVDLGAFARPKWFAQGKMSSCLSYLLARRLKLPTVEQLWHTLLTESKCVPSLNGRSTNGETHSEKVGKFTRFLRYLILANSQSAAARLLDALHARVSSNFYLVAAVLALIALTALRIIAIPFLSFLTKGDRWVEERFDSVLDSWRSEFPDRIDGLKRDDLLPYRSLLGDWKKLIDRYDIVIGYSTDPLLPLLCGKAYFAIEHGTIREIPYLRTSQGRLCALAYRMARHVFVTNFDCVDSARELAPGRFTSINHPYDEDHGLGLSGVDMKRASLCHELDVDVLIFHPTRHDWVEGTGYADKANHVLLDAFVELQKGALELVLSVVIGVGTLTLRRPCWQKLVSLPMSSGSTQCQSHPFELLSLSCDLVADQFKLGSFGGVAFKAMAVGVPILTYLNEELLLRQYPVLPPVVNCKTTQAIVDRLTHLFRNDSELKALGCASREWMKKYHAKSEVVNLQMEQFRVFLTSAP